MIFKRNSGKRVSGSISFAYRYCSLQTFLLNSCALFDSRVMHRPFTLRKMIVHYLRIIILDNRTLSSLCVRVDTLSNSSRFELVDSNLGNSVVINYQKYFCLDRLTLKNRETTQLLSKTVFEQIYMVIAV